MSQIDAPRTEQIAAIAALLRECEPDPYGPPYSVQQATFLYDAGLRAAAPQPRDETALRAALERQTDEATFVLAGVLELHRFRGRMSKVTVNDIAAVLGAAHNLTTDALRSALRAEGSSKPPEPQP